MKLLLVCMGTPHGVGGGNIGAHKAYTCIREICTENGIDFKSISLDNNIEENLGCFLVKNRTIDLLSRILGHTTFLYVMWLKYRNRIIKYKPDIVVLINSRLGFIAKDIKRKLINTKIIVGFENIEYDYAVTLFAFLRGWLKKFLILIERLLVMRDEKLSLQLGDSCIFLSHRDRDRAIEVYGCSIPNSDIIPACIQSAIQLNIEADVSTLVYVSSLKFKQNVVSLLWFLDNVWDEYFKENNGIKLIVAGAEPLPIVEERLATYNNITLYKGFKQLSDIIPKGSLQISPITAGAGMKVKIAEALAAGLHVLGTYEALVGYDEVIGAKGITLANSPEEFRDRIERYVKMDSDKIAELSRENQDLFNRFYTYKRAKATYEEVISLVRK